MNKTVLVDAYLGFGNFGDEYLVLATISKIKHSKRIYIKCCKCYTSIFFDNRLRKFNQNTVIFKWCNPIVPPLPYILLVDEIITVGGKYLGNIFEAIYLALLTLLAKIFRKKIFFVSIGLYPGMTCRDHEEKYETSILNKTLFKLAIILADFVSVRDIISKHTAMSLSGRDIRIELDPLLSYPFPLQLLSKERSNHIALILKALDTNYFPRLIANLIIFLRSINDETDLKIMCVEADVVKHGGPWLCELIGNKLVSKDRLKNKFIIKHEAFETLEILLTAKFAVIVGYHASILAIKFGVPSVSIVYEQKIKELEYLCNHVLHCKNIEFYDPAKLKHNDLNEVFSRACERLEGK